MFYSARHYLLAFKDDPELGFVEDLTVQDVETVRRLRQNIDDQRQLMAEFANENDIWFLDVTPRFIQEVQQGNLTFWTNDTHLNQHGNDIIHQMVLEFLIKNELIDENVLP